MTIHKRPSLPPLDGQEIWRLYGTRQWTVVALALRFCVSRPTNLREYLFVPSDDFSRELYAAILPEKTYSSAATFLEQVLEECPYTIECAYRVRCSQPNGKAERVIKTVLEMWHAETIFPSRHARKFGNTRFLNFYNTVKPHAGIDNMTPYEKSRTFFLTINTTMKFQTLRY